MWFRIGKWIELGVHFGSANERGGIPSRHFLHATVRWGEIEWYHGPVRVNQPAHHEAFLRGTRSPRAHVSSQLEAMIQPHLWR